MKICQYLDMNKSLVSLFSDSQYRSQRYHFTLETINKHHETITNRYQTSHDLLTYLHMSNTASTYQQPQSLQPHSQSRLAHSTLSEQHSVYLPEASVTTATQSVTSCTLYTVSQKQTRHQTFVHIFVEYCPIFKKSFIGRLCGKFAIM